MPPTVRHFKKYANRKFYDLDKGRYASLLDVGDAVAGGEEVEVICDRTGRDRTFETLTRALYERAKAYFSPSAHRSYVPEDPIARIAVMKIIRLIPYPVKPAAKTASKRPAK